MKKVEYVYLLLRRYLFRVNLNELSATKPPQLERVLEFQRHGLPIGMGAFMLDSKMYMTGGVKVQKDASLMGRLLDEEALDVSDGDDGLNSHVFVFDPSNPVAPFSGDHSIPSMCAGKTNAKVATIDGKIYILGCSPYYFWGELPSPAFECFDPARNLWEALPEPPYYGEKGVNQRQASQLSNFFVMGRKIHIRNGLGVFFYDVDAREWKYAVSFVSEYVEASVPFPFRLKGCVAERKDGLVLSYTLKGLVAYLYAPDGTLKRHQILHALNTKFPPSRHSSGFIRDLGDGKFCFIFSDSNQTSQCAVHVATFQVKMKTCVNDGGEDFLAAALLHCHVYDFDSLVDDSWKINDVFVMCEHSKKRGLECLELDRSCGK